MDICIYSTPEKLEHKKMSGYYYWYLRNPPKNFDVGDRVYFAVKGNVVGYFICDGFNPEKDEYGDPLDEETICWDSKTWKDIKPIPTNHFQGFKYFKMPEKEKSCLDCKWRKVWKNPCDGCLPKEDSPNWEAKNG